MKTKKVDRCKYCFKFLEKEENGVSGHCFVDGLEKSRNVTEEECEACERFESRYIEYPLTIQGLENKEIDTRGLGHECGCLCEIKPCGEEYQGKTYIGIYLGELPISICTSFDKRTGILENRTMNNPAIFVPELKKIVYGCESWWREIESAEDFKGISEEDIANTWYVKLLKCEGK